MTNLEFNQNIASKTTYSVPVLFGEPKYDNRKLYSYSIYEDNIVKEIRFHDKNIIKYYFDQDNFLSVIDTYNQNNELTRTKIELIEKSDNKTIFRDSTPGNGDGNHGTFEFKNENRDCELTFHRVNSFLGYNFKGLFKCNELGLFNEEQYFQGDSARRNFKFVRMLTNHYTMKKSKMDNLARKILAKGWSFSDAELKEIEN